MPRKLSPHQLNTLRELEPQLQQSAENADADEALQLMKRIQLLFENDRDHHRVLQAKNWYYQCLLEAGQTAEARRGLEAVLLRASANTRTFLEATSLLTVCLLRQGEHERAKQHLALVVADINAIKSTSRRHQFQRRLIDRINDECLLSLIIGRGKEPITATALQTEAIRLIQTKSSDELYELIAASLPSSAPGLLQNTKDRVLLLMPPADRKLLQGPKKAPANREMGEKALRVFKRIGWRAFCDESGPIYKLWREKPAEAFGKITLAAALAKVMAQWHIGVLELGALVLALLMSCGCAEFCDRFKPDGLMIPRSDKQ